VVISRSSGGSVDFLGSTKLFFNVGDIASQLDRYITNTSFEKQKRVKDSVVRCQ
jgi:hypothetical protein